MSLPNPQIHPPISNQETKPSPGGNGSAKVASLRKSHGINPRTELWPPEVRTRWWVEDPSRRAQSLKPPDSPWHAASSPRPRWTNYQKRCLKKITRKFFCERTALRWKSIKKLLQYTAHYIYYQPKHCTIFHGKSPIFFPKWIWASTLIFPKIFWVPLNDPTGDAMISGAPLSMKGHSQAQLQGPPK